jgi:hypothetical protein
MSRSIGFLLSLLLCLSLAPSAWAGEARLLAAADLPDMGGTDFKGGVGDYLLRNDEVEAVILAVASTPDFGIPIIAEALPGRGVLIDVGTRGDKNDQLGEIDHLVNLDQNLIFYATPGGLPAAVGGSGNSLFELSGSTASVTVSGVVLLEPFSSTTQPTIFAETIYSVTDGNSWIDITTRVINFNPFPVPVFSIADADVSVSRGRIPFTPFPARGHKPPPLDLANPFAAIAVFNYVSSPGNNGPADGPTNNDGSPSGEVSYTIVPNSLSTPLIGLATSLVTVVGNTFDLAAVASGSPPLLDPGAALVHQRKLVVAAGNSVEASLDIALPQLFAPAFGADLRGTFTGRIVDGSGTPVANAHIFFDNTTPGADPLLVGPGGDFRTILDEDQDGVPDGFVLAFPGDPLPTTHALSAADGTFTVRLQALPSAGSLSFPSVYSARIQAPERGTLTLPGLVVSPANIPALGGSPTDLGDITLSDTGTLSFVVNELGTGGTTPAKITIVGTGSTDDPDLGSQYLSLRNYSGLSKNGGDDGLDPVTQGNSEQLSEVLVGSPALNFDVDADGVGSLDLRPGTYVAFASRGLEYSLDAKPFSITAGATTVLSFDIQRVVDTSGFVSADFHIHSAKSFDSSVPMSDRVVSFLASGVEVMVATDHDRISDYASIIDSLGVWGEITSIVGDELTGGSPVPADATQGGLQAFPEGIGHWNAWPLTPFPTNRRNGAPQDEFVTPGTIIDRLRGMDSLFALGKTPDTATIPDWLTAIGIGDATGDDEVVQLNHPRAGFAGLVVIGLLNGLFNPGGDPTAGGYDPTQPISAFPNSLLETPSLYNAQVVGPGGTSTTALDFDALEVMNGSGVGRFLAVREDWCSLLRQGIPKAGTAVSDSHRLILENAGFARSFVASSTDSPAAVDEDELTANVKAMQLIGTTGPFVRFSVQDDASSDVGLGGTAVATGNKVVVKIRVEAAPWIPVEEVRVYRNCELIETLAVQSQKVLGQVNRFNRAIPLEGIDADSFLHVEAGIRLDASGHPLSPGLLETVQTVDPGVEPFAFTNPVFVDRDGNGYTPPGL